MKRRTVLASALSAAATPSLAGSPARNPAQPGLLAMYLRCEYLVHPLGVDVPVPRFSWELQASRRAERQTAYQVLVAGSEAALKASRGDVWDSGKVASDDTIAVEYAGKPLVSHQQCHWKVKVWDRDGRPGEWSAPTQWTVGLLRADDFKADWIGLDQSRNVETPEADFAPAQWIWHAADPRPEAPIAPRLFVSELLIPNDTTVERAELLVTADNSFRFVINARNAGAGDNFNAPQLVDVTRHLRSGANSLRCEARNAGGPAGLLVKLTVKLTNGKTITHVSDASWKTLQDPGANWHNRELNTSTWPNAAVLGNYGVAPWGKFKFARLVLTPVPYFRNSFRVERPVKRALLYGTALGIFDLHLNGQRVSDDWFNPGWTDYAKRVYYRCYDVTKLVRPGENALGAILADGWYSGYVGFGKKRNHYGTKPRVRAMLRLEFADGATAIFGTNEGWKATTGPLLESDFLMGESYDARKEMRGWDAPGFKAESWSEVNVDCEEVKPVVQWHLAPPVVTFKEIKPVELTEPAPGKWTYDLGQNFAGVVRLKLQGAPGQTITLRFAERLNPDGTVYTTNLREARCVDTYICKGGGVETWTPRFTFHGFQHVEVSGLSAKPTLDTITGLALSSDTPIVGKFECSDKMLNQLYSNIYWTQRMNFIDIPTDCPQRDERLGWTGDAQVYIRTASLICDVQPFFNKWLVDLADGQRADGQFPMVAPVKVAGDDGGPAWADAGTVCPWTIFEVYGDKRVLARQYPSMVKFVEFCRNRCTPELLPPARFHCFGDWLSINAATPTDVIFMAYFALSTKLTARAATTLGKHEDAAQWNALFERIKLSFNKAYVAADGRIKGDTQCVYVLALANELLDSTKAEQAAKHLVADLEKRGHLSTGFIGTKDLMLVLSKIGAIDVAYRLLHNETFPSWGFSIAHGATSIWERWDGWTPDKGFQDAGMNSFAHYSFGAVYQWMVENVAGIRSEGAAYKNLLIAPMPAGKLTWANTNYRSLRGEIATRWKLTDRQFTLEVTVPPNTNATCLLPGSVESIDGARVGTKTDGVESVFTNEGSSAVKLGSGSYKLVGRLR